MPQRCEKILFLVRCTLSEFIYFRYFRLSDMTVAPTEHSAIDLHPARACLFLHEDIVAKTLEFERELKEWRLSEIQAGRGDPGRPPYEYVFLVSAIVLPVLPVDFKNVAGTRHPTTHAPPLAHKHTLSPHCPPQHQSYLSSPVP